MDPITKTHVNPSHIWSKKEIIECGICYACNEEEDPEFERDEVNDIISVGAQDEYDVDPDTLANDTNDVDVDDCLSFIHQEKEENVELIADPTVEPVQEPAQEPAVEPVQEPVQEPVVEPVVEPAQEPVVEPAQEPAQEPVVEPAQEPAQEPAVDLVQEPAQEPAQEPVVELVIQPAQEPLQELEVQEQIIESEINLPFNIEKKEEKEDEDEDEEKGEPVTNNVIGNRLALDETIIEESAPKNIDVDENNLPFINEEKEEMQEPQDNVVEVAENPTNALESLEQDVQLDVYHADKILPIIDNEQEEKEDTKENKKNAEDRVNPLRRDIATFQAPPAKKFKWKDWFQSLWFWT